MGLGRICHKSYARIANICYHPVYAFSNCTFIPARCHNPVPLPVAPLSQNGTGSVRHRSSIPEEYHHLTIYHTITITMPLRYPIPATVLGLSRHPSASVLVPVALGTFFGLVTRTSVETWYPSLKKPKFNPPRWIFPVAWTYLYGSMGYAAHLLAETMENTPFYTVADQANLALVLYYAQLGLNFIWTPLFFGLKKPGLALIDILALTGTVFYMTDITRRIQSKATYFFLPYCAWLTYATYLNSSIWYLNGGDSKLSKIKTTILSFFAKSHGSSAPKQE
ncbi:hypothetical protein O181_075570 [Austropuccinia psidii MF-1]|uniref:TspO/MBR-related protein n=1 Tax=Austropuccinia psidii MF-1 TaxID=1389203 RepID=A0A9Q3IE57_9BASI|nr:hypothetical protein [Austropuccinia psidii MF-1]